MFSKQRIRKVSTAFSLVGMLGLVNAAPSTAGSAAEDSNANGTRAAAIPGLADSTLAADAPSGSKTLRLLLELQTAKPPVEGSDPHATRAGRPRAAELGRPPALIPAPSSSSASVATASVNPFVRAVEQARPTATRSPHVAASNDAWSRSAPNSDDTQAGPVARGGTGVESGPAVSLKLPLALMNFVRENRMSVLLACLAVLALLALSTSRAAHRRR